MQTENVLYGFLCFAVSSVMDEFLRKMDKTMQRCHMAPDGSRIIAGVSGGADSVCLLTALCRLSGQRKFRIRAVHVHHGLRANADGDEAFVRKLCDALSVPLTVVHADVQAAAKQGKTGVEEAGREIRYQAFFRAAAAWDREEQSAGSPAHPGALPESPAEQEQGSLIRQNGRALIAVAHHMEDLTETVLFNLCRGSGLSGLCGIRPVSGRIIRPFIEMTRGEIEAELTREGQPFRTDESNGDTAYTRNFLRLQIIPMLQKNVNAAAQANIARAAGEALEAREYIEGKVRECCEKCVSNRGAFRCADLSALAAEAPFLQRQVLYRMVAEAAGKRKDITSAHIDLLQQLCVSGGSAEISLPYGLVARKVYKELFIGPAGDVLPWEKDLRTGSSGAERFPSDVCRYRWRIIAAAQVPRPVPANEYTKWFDYDKIGSFPVFRTRKPGDRITVTEDGSRKTLSRLFIDCKVPADLRRRIVFPASGDEVLWIPGCRMSARYKVSDTTKTVLEISAADGGQDG